MPIVPCPIYSSISYDNKLGWDYEKPNILQEIGEWEHKIRNMKEKKGLPMPLHAYHAADVRDGPLRGRDKLRE